MDFSRVVQFLKALETEGVQYVLVGGVAMSVHGIVRATQDIDIFVKPEMENVNRLKRALHKVWNDPEIAAISYEELAGEYSSIRYGPPGENYAIDIMTRLGEAFRFEDLAAETVSWEGIRVSVATPETLYRMKKGTVRPVDRSDAAQLAERFGLQEK
jgi:nucleotidyltransferase AbiEii toxin of type IV toxin-antitoxin system